MDQPIDLDMLADKAHDLAVRYEQQYGGCGQCTIAAVLDALGLERPELFKAATAFAGGIGLAGDGSCGAYVGGVLLIGDQVGRTRADFADPRRVRFRTYALARRLRDLFVEKYGSVTCRDVQHEIFGRSFDLRQSDDFRAFEEAGGHADKCPEVAGTAARWIVELIGRQAFSERAAAE